MSWDQLIDVLRNIFVTQTGVLHITPGHVLMWGVGLLFLYLATQRTSSRYSSCRSASASSSSTFRSPR